MSRLPYWVLLCSSSWCLPAQPAIGQNGVVNRASRIPPTLAGGAIARGAAFTIHGVHLGPAAVVSVQKGNVTSPVPIVAAAAESLDAVMPYTAPLGGASLTVTVGGAASKPFPLEIAASNPGIFSRNKTGWGPGEIENINAAGKRVLNSSANPAHPGQHVAMKITGLGKGVAAMVMIGGRTVNAGAARRASKPGEQEISFAIPPGVPSGCYVPVYLLASPVRASNVVTIAIGTGPGTCDSGPVPLLEANRIGMVVISRADMHKFTMDQFLDEAIALFAAKGDGPVLSPLLLIPPPGTCTAYTSSLQSSTIMPNSISAALVAEIGGDGLAAGSQLTVARENGRRFIPWDHGAVGYYRARLNPLFLEPGKLVLSGAGGMDVGPFRMTADGPEPFEWIDRAQTAIVERSRALPMHWRGQANGRLTMLLATNVDQITTAIGTCLCTAPLNAAHFEIPAALLANIPASIKMPGVPYDQLFLASIPAKAAPLSAAGLGAGAIVTIYANGRYVQFH